MKSLQISIFAIWEDGETVNILPEAILSPRLDRARQRFEEITQEGAWELMQVGHCPDVLLILEGHDVLGEFHTIAHRRLPALEKEVAHA